MGTVLRGVPVEEPTPPPGVVNIGGEWFYEEYTPGTGVRELSPDGGEGAEGGAGPAAASDEEKRGILNLFGGKPE